ncbi:hypothetical protein M408DRAFT_329850 [Serendipita vermifera MAFF 305830]|uniref:Wax synthase domain-containing protein n=1 Tax=Serendipita vermifera MAFF 305830 TaxID=933852 RepID=A0A0C2WF35_SERVB|nr:hypothetical protein M408DRAFT_331501 [Serendipita vermifera MAFF 305830]KIM27943.1 hypothetical protein M408DRAFT_329850 [Serendipita vermifera MAFF 305830]
MIDLRLGGFFSGLEVPSASAPAVTAAFAFLLLAIFTLTLERSPANITGRFILCALSSYWFYQYGHAYEAPTRSVESGVSIISAYGIFRTIETSFGYLFEPLPRWVINGDIQNTPVGFTERCMWSLDLLLSMRGTSFFKNTHWDFAPAALIDPKHNKPKWTFVRERLFSLLAQIFLMDVFDTTVKAQAWPVMPESLYPITTLSPPFQLYYAVCVCMMTALSMNINYTAHSLGAVALGSPSAGWPPLFQDPFHASSLQAFWTHKWHSSFRRVFLMISSTAVDASRSFIPNRRARSAFRGLCIFALSCIMHLALMYRIRPPHLSPAEINFVERETLLFFLLQPVGMLLEVVLVKPIATYAFGENTEGRIRCTRVWAWAWLLWTGRYWSDVWVRHGMWGVKERVVGYSIVRGVLHGNWTQ